MPAARRSPFRTSLIAQPTEGRPGDGVAGLRGPLPAREIATIGDSLSSIKRALSNSREWRPFAPGLPQLQRSQRDVELLGEVLLGEIAA